MLRVFDTLVETGSVTGASELLHLSVPATSRALGRLRRTMNDLRERLVGIVRADTALGRRRRPTPAHLCEQAHVYTSRRGQAYGPLDETLAEAGLHRAIAAVVPSCAVAVLVVAMDGLTRFFP